MKANKELRDYAKLNKVYEWEVGRELNMSRSQMSVYLSKELSSNDEEIIKDLIRHIADKKKRYLEANPKPISKTNYELYPTWNMMLARCYNPNTLGYERYGGAGITVCDEWRNDFFAFNKWMLDNGWVKGLTIDRIDNEKGYCPENCRVADRYTQNTNRRHPERKEHIYNQDIRELIKVRGVQYKELAKVYGISQRYLSVKLDKHEMTDTEKQVIRECIDILVARKTTP